MKKVCFVVNNLRYFLSHRYDLALKLSEKFDHEVHVITSISSATDKEIGMCKKGNITLHHLNERTESINLLAYLLNLRNILIKGGFSVIFFVTLEASFFGALVSFFTKFNKIFFIISGVGHNFFNSRTKYKLIRYIQLRAIRLSSIFKESKFIFQNPDDLETFHEALSISRDKLFLIKGNGIDMQKFLYVARDFKDLTFCYAGRASYSKGFHTMMSAMTELKFQKPQLKFKLICCILTDSVSSKDSIDINKYLNDSGIDFIEYYFDLDSVSLVEIFHKSSIFILPSEREGISKAALEAASTGLPILTSNAVGAKESVLEGFNGLRFQVGDSNHLLTQLQKMLSSNKNLKYFGDNSKELVSQQFSLSEIADKYNRLIISI